MEEKENTRDSLVAKRDTEGRLGFSLKKNGFYAGPQQKCPLEDAYKKLQNKSPVPPKTSSATAKHSIVNGVLTASRNTVSKKLDLPKQTKTAPSAGSSKQIVNGVLMTNTASKKINDAVAKAACNKAKIPQTASTGGGLSTGDASKVAFTTPSTSQVKSKKLSLTDKCSEFVSGFDAKPAVPTGDEKEQRRVLVKAIKKFYNALDIDSINRSKIKIRRK